MEERKNVTEETAEEIPAPGGSGDGRSRRIGGRLLFENEFTIDEKSYLEFVKASMGQFRKIYYITGTISLLLALVTFMGEGAGSSLLFMLVALLCFGMPRYTVNSSWKKKYDKQLERNGGKPMKRRVLFYEDGLEVFSNSGSHSVFDYEDITKVVSSGSLYILIVQKRMSLLVLKDQFTQGSLEEWKAFMGTKGKWRIR